MTVYSGIDLHSNSNYVGIIDSTGKRIFKEKLPNDITVINEVLAPFGAAMQGVVMESTYNLVVACGWSDGRRIRRTPGESL